GGESVLGGAGDDDLIFGEAGNDTVDGLKGDDSIDGGAGNDSLVGNSGDDTIIGDDGDDSIYGGSGADSISADSGSDSVEGGAGNDSIATGSSGTDLPNLGASDAFGAIIPGSTDTDPTDDEDIVVAGSGDDTITTGDDNDTIFGGTGNDSIDGGIDNDSIEGGAGNDTILDGHGSDTVYGGSGDDSMGSGIDWLPDSIDPLPNDGNDLMYGGAGNDTITVGDDADTVYGGTDNDSITAGVDNDLIYGDSGDDTVTGAQGDDTISGGQGNDSILGGTGDDTLYAGAGNDTVTGGIGNDLIGTDSGDDSIVHSDGTDTIFGGSGRDTIDVNTPNGSVFGGGAGSGDDHDVLDISDAVSPGGTYQVSSTTDTDGNGITGTVTFYDSLGAVEGTLNFNNIEEMICFARGTQIQTARGGVMVEDLQEGDRVLTMDNGFQPIRWIGSKSVKASGKLAPIEIQEGAMGNERALRVSPMHRMLVSGWQAELLFGENEVLVPAKMLVNDQTIRQVEGGDVEYFHVLFDRHEIIYAEAIPSESFHPGHQGFGALAEETRAEILELFPQLENENFEAYGPTARRTLKGFEAEMLLNEMDLGDKPN
ncbi:MAG: Hint domain-containing protein, partial [Planktomarina sp.]